MPKIILDEHCIEEIDNTSSPTHYLIRLSNGEVVSLPKLNGITVIDNNESGKDNDVESL
jgi:hypothetical protein